MAKDKKKQIQLLKARESNDILGSDTSKALKVKHSHKKDFKAYDQKEWEKATCAVCLEPPHNAVLLLCSSYEKGCRPYMCATGRRYSNCLEQYKKAYMKVMEVPSTLEGHGLPSCVSFPCGLNNGTIEISELLCPLCRGQVKGMTVVKPARRHLNTKRRTCMQDKCSFFGNYKQLRKHVKKEHPTARPRAVDPVLEEKWKRLEQQRERNDVISTITSSIPGAVVLGDYVLEPSHRSFPNHQFGQHSDIDLGPFGRNSVTRANGTLRIDYDSLDSDDSFYSDDSGAYHFVAARLPSSARLSRVVPTGTSRRRHRRRRGSQVDSQGGPRT